MGGIPFLLDRDLASRAGPPATAPDAPVADVAATVAAARAAGHAAGLAEGRAAARAEAEAETRAALERVAAALRAVDGSMEAAVARMEVRTLGVVRTLLDRLAPVVVARAGSAPALRHVRAARRLACGSPWVRITLSEAAARRHGPALSRAGDPRGGDGAPRVEVVADPSFADGAAEVEWRGGRSGLDPARLIARLGDALADALPEETSDD